MLLALALYLYDASRLLASHEAVLVRGWRGHWRAAFGAHHWKIAGREPYVPNPLAPHQPIFQLRWSFVAADRTRQGRAAELCVPPGIEFLGPFVWGSAFCLFVWLPLGLFGQFGMAYTLAAVGVLYLNNVVALAWVGWRRTAFKLSARQYAGLAFECLVCPPFSINLVRRLCALWPVAEDFTAAAKRLVPTEAQAGWHAQCLLRVDEQVDCEDDGQEAGRARMAALQQARARFSTQGQP